MAAAMKYRKLGSMGLAVSVVGRGTYLAAHDIYVGDSRDEVKPGAPKWQNHQYVQDNRPRLLPS